MGSQRVGHDGAAGQQQEGYCSEKKETVLQPGAPGTEDLIPPAPLPILFPPRRVPSWPLLGTEAAGPVPRDGGWAGCLPQTPITRPITCPARGTACRWEPLPSAQVTARSPDPSLPPKARPLHPRQTLHLAFQALPDLATLGPAVAPAAGTKGEPPHPAPPHPPHTFCLGLYQVL